MIESGRELYKKIAPRRNFRTSFVQFKETRSSGKQNLSICIITLRNILVLCLSNLFVCTRAIIFCLSYLLAGEYVEPVKLSDEEIEQKKKEFWSTRVKPDCRHCLGTGRKACFSCSGSGKDSRGFKTYCEDCRGMYSLLL